VFTSNDFSDSDVWSVAAAGGQVQSITPARLRCYEPVYSRDGRSIYYSTEGAGLLEQAVSSTTGAAAGEPVQIISPGTTGIRHVALSANGKRMLYSAVSGQSNVWSIPLSAASGSPTGSPHPLTQNSSYRNTSPVFSPDGRKIAFNTWRRAAVAEIWLMDQDGSNQVQLMADTRSHNVVGWFQDVDHLAFAGLHGGRWGIQGLTLAAGRETQLVELPPNAGFFVRIAPDGHAVAYHTVGGRAMNIWIEDVPSGQLRQLTFDDQSMAFPCWSPDSKFIALQVTRGEATNICVVPTAGGTPIQLTHDRGLSWAYSWSPDGDKIAFAGTRNGIWNIYWVSRGTGEQHQVTAYSKTNAYVRYPAWSPLGDQIVYEYAETTGNIWMAEFR
jgi:Tol biopolymer transport system component